MNQLEKREKKITFIHKIKAYVYSVLREPEFCLKEIEKLLKLQPLRGGQENILVLQGKSYQMLGQYDKALEKCIILEKKAKKEMVKKKLSKLRQQLELILEN